MCGADAHNIPSEARGEGSPPRVRSRPSVDLLQIFVGGITSACAEQTADGLRSRIPHGDHLRVCGADLLAPIIEDDYPGSPPRVRSRPDTQKVRIDSLGITSACAEQTYSVGWSDWVEWDHLRVCGADASAKTVTPGRWGSPPRVRSRPHLITKPSAMVRITSACAEQTVGVSGYVAHKGDHLRVCGADFSPIHGGE